MYIILFNYKQIDKMYCIVFRLAMSRPPTEVDIRFANFLDQAWVYGPPTILAIGFIGNIFTLIIMNRKSFR